MLLSELAGFSKFGLESTGPPVIGIKVVHDHCWYGEGEMIQAMVLKGRVATLATGKGVSFQILCRCLSHLQNKE